jgi:ketosteroid isomerase-like protein
MSQQNVEIVRHIVELANQGDVDGIVALMDPDIECVPAADQPESKPFRGRDAFARYALGWLEVFDHYAIEPSEYLHLGEYVVVVGRVVARGRGSGVETADGDAWVWRLQNGRAIEYQECGTKERALQAVGDGRLLS